MEVIGYSGIFHYDTCVLLLLIIPIFPHARCFLDLRPTFA